MLNLLKFYLFVRLVLLLLFFALETESIKIFHLLSYILIINKVY